MASGRHDGVHDPGGRSRAAPGHAPVGRLPEALRGCRIDFFRLRRVLRDCVGAPCRVGNALNFSPLCGAVVAAINSRTSTGVDAPRVRTVDQDAHDVRIVNHSFVDGIPGAPAVRCLPGQMKRSSVDDLRIARIDRERVKIAQFRVMFGRNALPGFGRVKRSVDPVQTFRRPGCPGPRGPSRELARPGLQGPRYSRCGRRPRCERRRRRPHRRASRTMQTGRCCLADQPRWL